MTRTAASSTTESQEGEKPRRKARGVISIDSQRCKGCGYCVEFCPLSVLIMSRKFNAKGYHFPEIADEARCAGCDLCGMYCPDFAIYAVRVRDQSATKE